MAEIEDWNISAEEFDYFIRLADSVDDDEESHLRQSILKMKNYIRAIHNFLLDIEDLSDKNTRGFLVNWEDARKPYFAEKLTAEQSARFSEFIENYEGCPDETHVLCCEIGTILQNAGELAEKQVSACEKMLVKAAAELVLAFPLSPILRELPARELAQIRAIRCVSLLSFREIFRLIFDSGIPRLSKENIREGWRKYWRKIEGDSFDFASGDEKIWRQLFWGEIPQNAVPDDRTEGALSAYLREAGLRPLTDADFLSVAVEKCGNSL